MQRENPLALLESVLWVVLERVWLGVVMDHGPNTCFIN
jgi:hypothetical protein